MKPPDTEEHTIIARAYETYRPLKLALVELQPGQEGPIRLPNAGRRPMDYLSLVIDGEAKHLTDVTTNHTKKPVALYHGIWLDTGNNAGWWLPEYFEVEGGRNHDG